MIAVPGSLANWSGNHVYGAEQIDRPRSLGELRQLAATAPQIHALGTRHSFTAIGDARHLISFERFGRAITLDRAAMTVTVDAGVTYAELAGTLNRERLALANLASLADITVVGAVSTATHGSGDRNGTLATAVTRLELVTSAGELLVLTREDERLAGAVVGLGALGVVARATLEVQPYYEMRQHVYEELEWDALFSGFDEITAAGESVSVFHRFGDRVAQVWVKHRVGGPGDRAEPLADLRGARPARAPRHPVLGGDPANCTPQLGQPGPWSERLPHFRSGVTPSSGEEIQSEWLVAREHAAPAIRALAELAGEIRPLLLTCELRTIAADTHWLSPSYGRDSVGLHFTWRRRHDAVQRVVARIEAALEPLRPRPHWAKLFTADAAALATRYERLADFRRLRAELDPRGAFTNDWLHEHVIGSA